MSTFQTFPLGSTSPAGVSRPNPANLILPGVYRHFKNNMYFVLGLAYSREDPTNLEKAEVIYHPLYPVENMGWRRDISLANFVEHVDRPEFNYSGPRFVKVGDWDMPNILPGCPIWDTVTGYCFEIIAWRMCSEVLMIEYKDREGIISVVPFKTLYIRGTNHFFGSSQGTV